MDPPICKIVLKLDQLILQFHLLLNSKNSGPWFILSFKNTHNIGHWEKIKVLYANEKMLDLNEDKQYSLTKKRKIIFSWE